MTEIIEKLEHGIMVCSATGTMLVHIDKSDAEKVIALLKEQEAVPVIQREIAHLLFWCCGSCGVAITDGDKFCRMCGKKMKWK